MRGEEAAVLVPVEQWRRLNARARPGLKALLLKHEEPAGSDTRHPPTVRPSAQPTNPGGGEYSKAS